VRRAANENPVVQAALIAGLLILFAIIFYMRVLSGGSESTTESTAPTSTTGATATPAAPGATATTPTAPGVAPPATAPAPGAEAQGSIPDSALKPGKGLPAPVVNAYDDGKAIVLLIVKQRGIDDKRVKAYVEALRGRPDLNVAVFVTGAKNIAHYSRIANGVGVSQVPALIVIRPKSVSGKIPKATVSYGFRGPESVLQAVEDALYKGHNVPYYPD